VPYAEIAEHYLTDRHQHCLIKFITEVFSQSFGGQAMLSSRRPNDDYQHSLSVYIGKTESLIEEVNPIVANCSRLDSERQMIATQINAVRTESIKIKESSDNSAKLIESLHQILVNMITHLDDIKRKPIPGPKLMSLDSKYIWKVNFHVLINNGRTLQSEPFHTSQSGYRIMISCDIHVDEQNQKRYLSVSFTILPGEFDAILSWPFMFPITLSIVDLTAAKKHVTHSIPRSVILSQPKNNMPSSYCAKKFCLIDPLLENGNNYIQDGFMFIEVYMDFMAPGVNPIPTKGPLRTTIDPIQTNILSDLS
jgi:hypothetical protein